MLGRIHRRVIRILGAGLFYWLICGAVMSLPAAAAQSPLPKLEPVLHALAIDIEAGYRESLSR